MSAENPYGCSCNPPQATGLRPGTIVVIESPDGVTTEGDCATCGGPIVRTELREHPVLTADEIRMAQAMGLTAYGNGMRPRDMPDALGIDGRIVDVVIHGWDARGWYDYGVCEDLGWLTPEGVEALLARGAAPKEPTS